MRISSERMTVGFIFVGVAALACLAPVKTDTWWLLRGGQDIWQTRTVMLTDVYSYTAAGRLWPNHEWLTELAFYGLFAAGGLPLLTAGCAVLMVATWMLSWRLTRGSFELRILLLAVCLTALPASFAIRPQVFSMFLFIVTCTLLAERRFWWLIPVFICWVNLHGAVALGMVAVGAAWLVALLSRERLPALTWTALACGAATLVSPLGWRLWPEILISMERSRVNALREWEPPGFTAAHLPFWALGIALSALILWRWKAADARTRTLAAIALAVLPLAMRSVRNVHIFLLVALPAITALLSRNVPSPARRVREHESLNAALLGVAGVVAAAVVVLGWRAPAPHLGWQPISSTAADAIRSCPEPLYNTYGEGGILIWFVPEKRVFIDNRQDPYPTELLAANLKLEMDGRYEETFAKYGVRCAALPSDSPITTRLRADAGWSLRHADTQWAVFVKR